MSRRRRAATATDALAADATAGVMVANATATTSMTVVTQTRSVTVTDAVTEDVRMADGVMTRATVAEVTPNVAAFTYATFA